MRSGAFTEGLLRVKHTRSYDGKPLCVLENMPGWGCEVFPAQMRDMARALLQAAQDCEQRGASNRREETRTYPMDGKQGGAA